MSNRKRLVHGALLLGLAFGGPMHAAGADDEGVRTGVVRQVDESAGIVVIDGQRYRYGGQPVQPPAGISPESDGYRTRPFTRGMIVRFTVEPGDPPGIQEAWALDQ